MKNIVVTGGAGFIGSHLIEALLDDETSVVCLDNFFTGTRKNILPFLRHPNFEFIRHDVVVPILLEADVVYHLACPASPVHYQNNPIKTLKTSVLGTLNLLGLAKRVKARILLASTSEVYGDPEVHPQPETYNGNVNPVGPRACYDEGKRAAETLMVGYRDYNKVDVTIARIFNTYGPRMLPNDGRVVSNFICQILRGEDLTIYGDGSQTRSFCYVGGAHSSICLTIRRFSSSSGTRSAKGILKNAGSRGIISLSINSLIISMIVCIFSETEKSMGDSSRCASQS